MGRQCPAWMAIFFFSVPWYPAVDTCENPWNYISHLPRSAVAWYGLELAWYDLESWWSMISSAESTALLSLGIAKVSSHVLRPGKKHRRQTMMRWDLGFRQWMGNGSFQKNTSNCWNHKCFFFPLDLRSPESLMIFAYFLDIFWYWLFEVLSLLLPCVWRAFQSPGRLMLAHNWSGSTETSRSSSSWSWYPTSCFKKHRLGGWLVGWLMLTA